MTQLKVPDYCLKAWGITGESIFDAVWWSQMGDECMVGHVNTEDGDTSTIEVVTTWPEFLDFKAMYPELITDHNLGSNLSTAAEVLIIKDKYAVPTKVRTYENMKSLASQGRQRALDEELSILFAQDKKEVKL